MALNKEYFFYKTETFLNPTNTEGAVNKKIEYPSELLSRVLKS